MPRIGIINYGMGNIRNVQKSLEKVGSNVQIITRKDEINQMDAIVLPGVGAFRDAIKNFSPFVREIYHAYEAGIPLLGICLGMQLLFTESTEGGSYRGLDIFKGRVLRLPEGRKVPHIGWNSIQIEKEGNPLVKDIHSDSYVYFVHSYYTGVDQQEDIVAITEYGITFPSIVCKGNVYATQFHPEKSGRIGLRILQNFVEIVR